MVAGPQDRPAGLHHHSKRGTNPPPPPLPLPPSPREIHRDLRAQLTAQRTDGGVKRFRVLSNILAFIQQQRASPTPAAAATPSLPPSHEQDLDNKPRGHEHDEMMMMEEEDDDDDEVEISLEEL